MTASRASWASARWAIHTHIGRGEMMQFAGSDQRFVPINGSSHITSRLHCIPPWTGPASSPISASSARLMPLPRPDIKKRPGLLARTNRSPPTTQTSTMARGSDLGGRPPALSGSSAATLSPLSSTQRTQQQQSQKLVKIHELQRLRRQLHRQTKALEQQQAARRSRYQPLHRMAGPVATPCPQPTDASVSASASPAPSWASPAPSLASPAHFSAYPAPIWNSLAPSSAYPAPAWDSLAPSSAYPAPAWDSPAHFSAYPAPFWNSLAPSPAYPAPVWDSLAPSSASSALSWDSSALSLASPPQYSPTFFRFCLTNEEWNDYLPDGDRRAVPSAMLRAAWEDLRDSIPTSQSDTTDQDAAARAGRPGQSARLAKWNRLVRGLIAVQPVGDAGGARRAWLTRLLFELHAPSESATTVPADEEDNEVELAFQVLPTIIDYLPEGSRLQTTPRGQYITAQELETAHRNILQYIRETNLEALTVAQFGGFRAWVLHWDEIMDSLADSTKAGSLRALQMGRRRAKLGIVLYIGG
ncbi:hypothetical protein P8C59_006501 [Phyllachora maydis]|uniref:Uncharacterized protein n=1 Tax=Phyllachora maydis TaxID=1825666 RepID=A0AAD9I892_9PEZI|nr:hypothetical protein P8C59_006501 [Phyllachora maydis]